MTAKAAVRDGSGRTPPTCRVLHDHLSAIRGSFPVELVPGRAADAIASLPPGLPPFRSSVIECRLGPGSNQVDFAWKYTIDQLRGRHIEGEPWRWLDEFASDWSDPRSLLSGEVYGLGLEFDLDDEAPDPNLPSPFFIFSGDDAGRTIDAIDRIESFIRPASDRAWGGPLWRCIEALPHGSRINYCGFMLVRRSRGLRLGIEHISPQGRIGAYLDTVGWQGARDALCHFIDDLPPPLRKAAPVLALDLGDGVEPRVGLEYLLCHDQAAREYRSRLLLDHLVGMGLCSPAKRDAALRWPTGWCECFLHGEGTPPVTRFISHIKLVFGVQPEAKCYLEACVT